MVHLIDKDALVAEIERKKQKIKAYCLREVHDTRFDVVPEQLSLILSFIDTLEVKEVDLEKEIELVKGDYEQVDVSWNNDFDFIAKHFFKLGLNTKQTSEDIKIGETKIYLDDDGGEPPYDGKQWLDLGCTEYEIPLDKFKDGDNVEIIIRKTQKVE